MPDVRRELRFPLDGMVMIVCGEQELLRLPGCGQDGGKGKARSRPSAELEHESQACELPGVRDLVTLADASSRLRLIPRLLIGGGSPDVWCL